MHCLCCTALSGCYFAADNKPEKHPNCDCEQFPIAKPYNEAKATCDVRKFTGYILGKLDKYGQRITITINLRNGVKMKSGWLVHPLGVITCTTPLGG